MKKESYNYIISSGVFLVIGTFLIALCYNWILLPNNFVVSGISGVAIVLHKLFNLNTTFLIYLANFILLIISFIFLGNTKTKNTIIGTILYPLLVTLTMPIAEFLNIIFPIDDTYLLILIGFLLLGIGNGLIFKYGFTTGGSDVIMQLVSKYFKISEGKARILINIVVILSGALTFGYMKGIYSLIILLLSTTFIDKILFGISNSKVFFIYTRKYLHVKKVILEEFSAGFTILPTYGGYSHTKGKLIMCVLPNRDYYSFKEKIMAIDPSVFFVIQDCYEVEGGLKRSNLRFLDEINNK